MAKFCTNCGNELPENAAMCVKCGINGTIRREMGSDIDGACGQLRKRYMEKTESEK